MAMKFDVKQYQGELSKGCKVDDLYEINIGYGLDYTRLMTNYSFKGLRSEDYIKIINSLIEKLTEKDLKKFKKE